MQSVEPVSTLSPATLSELLTTWRREKRWSQRMLAMRSGVSNATLSRWEAGTNVPRLAELGAVLDALHLEPQQREQALIVWRAAEGRAVSLLPHTAPPSYPVVDLDVPVPDVVQSGAIRSPITGDLLRALRQRQGYSQAEVARAIGVWQSTIARWEEGASAPETQQLQALCYFLQPQEAELLALAAGQFCLTDDDPQAVQEKTERTPLGAPLYDLQTFSCFEVHHRTRWYRAPESTHAFFMACYSYARNLGYLGRFREARIYLAQTEQILPLFSSELAARRQHYLQDIQQTLRALIDTEQSIYGSGTSTTQGMQITLKRKQSIPRHRYTNATQRLLPLLNTISDVEVRSWVLMYLARYTYGVEDIDNALRYAEDSWRVMTEDWLRIEQHPPSVQRRILHARLLVRANRPNEAATLLPSIEQQAQAWYTLPGDVNYSLTAQAWAEVYTAVGDDSRATYCRAQATSTAPTFMKSWVD